MLWEATGVTAKGSKACFGDDENVLKSDYVMVEQL